MATSFSFLVLPKSFVRCAVGPGPGAPPLPRAWAPSPAVVRESLVGLGHLVRVLTPLDARAESVARVEKLVHEPLGHRLLPACARVGHEPAQRQGGAAGGPHLH